MKIVVHQTAVGPPWFKEYQENPKYDRLEADTGASGALRIVDMIINEFAVVAHTREVFAPGTWIRVEYVRD